MFADFPEVEWCTSGGQNNRYVFKAFDALGTGIYYPCRKMMEVKLEDIQNGFIDMMWLLLSNHNPFLEFGQQ